MGDDGILIFRGVERLLATAGGIVSLVCGILLYKWGTSGASQLVIENKDTKFRLTNAGPGLLLGLFGMVVVGISLYRPLESNTDVTKKTITQKLDETKEESSTEKTRFSYSGDAKKTFDIFLTEFSNKQFDAIEDKNDLIKSIQVFQARAVDVKKELAKAKNTTK